MTNFESISKLQNSRIQNSIKILNSTFEILLLRSGVAGLMDSIDRGHKTFFSRIIWKDEPKEVIVLYAKRNVRGASVPK